MQILILARDVVTLCADERLVNHRRVHALVRRARIVCFDLSRGSVLLNGFRARMTVLTRPFRRNHKLAVMKRLYLSVAVIA